METPKNVSIHSLVEACKQGSPEAQKALFMKMYNFGMSIAFQYSSSKMEAEEIAQDGFYKMFRHLEKYKPHVPFELWLRRIIINCGIDHYRKYSAKKQIKDLPLVTIHNDGELLMDSEYLVQCIQSLSPAYRMVFNLYVIEGYSHKEIAEKLSITEGTSKSNLSKARRNLQAMIKSENIEEL